MTQNAPSIWLIEGDIALETRERFKIPNVREPQRNPTVMRLLAARWKERLPDIQVRSLASTYNCMGLPFASRRVSVLPADGSALNQLLKQILDDDGYRQIDCGVARRYRDDRIERYGVVEAPTEPETGLGEWHNTRQGRLEQRDNSEAPKQRFAGTR